LHLHGEDHFAAFFWLAKGQEISINYKAGDVSPATISKSQIAVGETEFKAANPISGELNYTTIGKKEVIPRVET